MQEQEGDLISIIMAAYNPGSLIKEAIDSVLTQSHSNWELIIVNDGSTDSTQDFIDSYDDPRIRCIKTKNQGVSTARNEGLKLMKGDFFCFLDSDDKLPKRSLEVRLNEMSDPNVAFVDGVFVRMDETLTNKISEQRPYFKGNPFKELILMTGSCFSGPTWLIRNDLQREYRYKDGLTHAEDLLFCVTICDQGEYRAVDEPILLYRSGHFSAMSNIDGSKKGFEIVHEELSKRYLPQHQDLIKSFETKARSIIFKSYLKAFKFGKAVRSLGMFR